MRVRKEGRANKKIGERRHKHIMHPSFRDSNMEDAASRTGISMQEILKIRLAVRKAKRG